jgi:hypothetical protein
MSGFLARNSGRLLMPSQTESIQSVIDQVKDELAEARSQAPDLNLKELELELAIVVEKSGNAGVIVKGELGDSIAHKIVLTYAPPAPKKKDESVMPPIGLGRALRTIQESLKAGQKQEPKLNLKTGEVSLEFAVTKTGGIEFEFGPVKGGVEYKREDSNTVTLKFEA